MGLISSSTDGGAGGSGWWPRRTKNVKRASRKVFHRVYDLRVFYQINLVARICASAWVGVTRMTYLGHKNKSRPTLGELYKARVKQKVHNIWFGLYGKRKYMLYASRNLANFPLHCVYPQFSDAAGFYYPIIIL